MGSILRGIQPAVKKETKRVTVITAIGIGLMWIRFLGSSLDFSRESSF